MKLAVDWSAFGHELGAALEPHLRKLGQDGLEGLAKVRQFQARVEATLKALEHESDPETAKALQESLELVLPADRAAIESLVASKLAAESELAFFSALDVVLRLSLFVAKSFSPVPIPDQLVDKALDIARDKLSQA